MVSLVAFFHVMIYVDDNLLDGKSSVYKKNK